VTDETPRTARLIHRGEHFRFTEGEREYEGECVWSWRDTGDGPTRTYPVVILPLSIHRVGEKPRARTSRDEQRAIAVATKTLLEAQDPGGSYVVAD
jgi:hypothetical protein